MEEDPQQCPEQKRNPKEEEVKNREPHTRQNRGSINSRQFEGALPC